MQPLRSKIFSTYDPELTDFGLTGCLSRTVISFDLIMEGRNGARRSNLGSISSEVSGNLFWADKVHQNHHFIDYLNFLRIGLKTLPLLRQSCALCFTFKQLLVIICQSMAEAKSFTRFLRASKVTGFCLATPSLAYHQNQKSSGFKEGQIVTLQPSKIFADILVKQGLFSLQDKLPNTSEQCKPKFGLLAPFIPSIIMSKLITVRLKHPVHLVPYSSQENYTVCLPFPQLPTHLNIHRIFFHESEEEKRQR